MAGITSLAQEFGVLGCPNSCRRSHLLPGTVQRLLRLGITRNEIADCLEHEMTAHGPAGLNHGLTGAGRRNLVAWGASATEIESIEDVSAGKEPIRLDFYERERARVASSRSQQDPDDRKARAREHARAYRARKRGVD